MKFLDLKSQYLSIKKEIDDAIQEVLNSCVFIKGEQVEKFEKEIASFCGVSNAIGVNSGTDSLFLALKSLGIGPGDEVITSPFTFIATAEVIANLGAKPVFADINPVTFNISPSKIEESITKKTKVILPVHLFGQMADMDEIIEIAKKREIFIVEDAAQAIGAEYKNRMAGSLGDVGCFSFFPSKNLGAFGDGGMIVTKDEEIANKVRLLRDHGSSPEEKYLNLILGINSRLDEIQASILRVKLKHLLDWSNKRREIASFYNDSLEKVLTPKTLEGRSHIFHQYIIRTEKRDELKEYLKKKDIPTMIYYSLPLHLQPAFKCLGHKEGDFPEAEKASKEVLSLPIYPEISREDQDLIIKQINSFDKQY